jgi:hypothetical protein
MNRLPIASILLLASLPAYTYETGVLTCERLGEAAVSTLEAKRASRGQEAARDDAVAGLEPGAEVERRLLNNLVLIIYRNDLIDAMQPGDIYAVFRNDCLAGRILDAR